MGFTMEIAAIMFKDIPGIWPAVCVMLGGIIAAILGLKGASMVRTAASKESKEREERGIAVKRIDAQSEWAVQLVSRISA